MDQPCENLLYKELSYQIIAAVFEVHNHLGSGFLEKVYEKALLREFQLRGIKAVTQKELPVSYKGEEIACYYADILVNDEILLELKALDKITPQHEAQVLNYLKATGIRLGLLINFGNTRVEYKRLLL